MNYYDPYAKFGDFSFSRFGFIMRIESQTESYTEADDRNTHATSVTIERSSLLFRNTDW